MPTYSTSPSEMSVADSTKVDVEVNIHVGARAESQIPIPIGMYGVYRKKNANNNQRSYYQHVQRQSTALTA